MNEHHFSIIEDPNDLPIKTIDQDDVDLAYQEGWGNGPRVGSIPIWSPRHTTQWQNVFHQFYCQRIVFIRSFNMLALRFGGYDYNLPLERIETERDLLAWVRHLSSKEDWITLQRLRVIIDAVATIKGFEIKL